VPPAPSNVLIVPPNNRFAIVITPFPVDGSACIVTAEVPEGFVGVVITGRDMVNVNDE
jgi:hypothetical protein